MEFEHTARIEDWSLNDLTETYSALKNARTALIASTQSKDKTVAAEDRHELLWSLCDLLAEVQNKIFQAAENLGNDLSSDDTKDRTGLLIDHTLECEGGNVVELQKILDQARSTTRFAGRPG